MHVEDDRVLLRRPRLHVLMLAAGHRCVRSSWCSVGTGASVPDDGECTTCLQTCSLFLLNSQQLGGLQVLFPLRTHRFKVFNVATKISKTTVCAWSRPCRPCKVFAVNLSCLGWLVGWLETVAHGSACWIDESNAATRLQGILIYLYPSRPQSAGSPPSHIQLAAVGRASTTQTETGHPLARKSHGGVR